MSFPDHFSEGVEIYASARPRYPDSLYAYVASLAPSKALAWDCGTGNGQAATGLSAHFAKVCATDPSASQIQQAKACPNVEYSVQQAEKTWFPTGAFDAVCVAQALHWFDLRAFFSEAHRVMKPGAVFAAWGYNWFQVSPEFETKFKRSVLDVIASDWPPQNALLWRDYRDIDLPFRPVDPPSFEIREEWDFHQLLAYVQSWSATRRCIERLGHDFLERAAGELAPIWGAPEQRREIVMPLSLRVGIHLVK